MKTDPLTPPPPMVGVDCWERCPDPYHRDAFSGIDLDPEFTTVVVIGGGEGITEGVRREGWAAIDWCGNMVGWYPDGTEFGGEALEYKTRQGPYGTEYYLDR